MMTTNHLLEIMRKNNQMDQGINLQLRDKKKVDNQNNKKKKLNLIQMMIGKKLKSRKRSLNGKNKTLRRDFQKN